MKSSKSVKIMFLGGAAAVVMGVVNGCASKPEMNRVCTDKKGKVVKDTYCDDRSYAGGVHPYMWYYGTRSYPMGSRVSGGTRNVPSASSYRIVGQHSSSTSRGVFGRSASGRVGFGG